MNLLLAILFLLLPTYLIRFSIGPIPTTLLEVMIWIILVVWIIKVIKFEKLKTVIDRLSHISYLNLSLVISISIFLLSATYSAFVTSINTRAALGEWKAFYIEPFLIFLILIIEGTKNSEKKTDNLSPISYRLSPIHSLLFALILCGLVTSLLAIYQHFTGWMVPWAFWENGSSYRVTAWYGFPNGVGLFLAPIIPLAIYCAKQSWSVIARSRDDEAIFQSNKIASLTRHGEFARNYRFACWAILISSFLFIISVPLAIIFAKSTSGLIGAAAGIGLLLVFWKKTRWPVLVLGTVAILGIFFVLPKDNYIRHELLMQDRSGQIRINMWGEAIELLSTRPLQGAGLASYQQLIVPYHHPINGNDNIEIFHHQHNIFLTMWVNLGLFGLIGFVWMLVWFYRVGLQNIISYHLSPLSIYLLASMTALITTGLVDSPYIKNDLSLFFWLLFALMIIVTCKYETMENS